MKQDFYELQLAKIESLIKAKQYDKARLILEAEMMMPYIPARYAKKFMSLKKQLKTININQKPIKQVSLNQILEMLWKDEAKQIIALNSLPRYFLEPVKQELKQRIESWNDVYKKGFLYEILVEQKIKIEININGQILNPTQFSILKNNNADAALAEIKQLAFKMPQIEALAISELYKYLLMTFPKSDIQGKALGIIIFNIVNHLVTGLPKLKPKEKTIKEILDHKK